MKVSVKCFSSLVQPEKCDFRESISYDLEEGQTVEDLARSAGIDKSNVKLIFVNSKKAGFDTKLSDGDRVGMAPVVGGM